MLLLKILSFSMTLAHAPVAPAPATIEDIAFVSGNWAGSAEGADVDYQYGEARGGMLLGQGRFTADGQVVFFEFEAFRAENGELTLTPAPFGQPGVTFKATLIEPGHVVFSCPENDFPRIIEYKLLADGSLYSKAEGVENGAPRVVAFVQHRTERN